MASNDNVGMASVRVEDPAEGESVLVTVTVAAIDQLAVRPLASKKAEVASSSEQPCMRLLISFSSPPS